MTVCVYDMKWPVVKLRCDVMWCECLCLVGPLVCIIVWVIAKAVVADPLHVTYLLLYIVFFSLCRGSYFFVFKYFFVILMIKLWNSCALSSAIVRRFYRVILHFDRILRHLLWKITHNKKSRKCSGSQKPSAIIVGEMQNSFLQHRDSQKLLSAL